MPDRFICTTDDVLRALDDLLEARGGEWWDGFFADRSKPVPFFADRQDESLVEWFGAGLLAPGRVLELGCGPGRNAIYLAGQGCRVEAVDFSAGAIEWARQRAEAAGAAVEFRCCSIFDATFGEAAYDLVYDSGCFHHLAPHRRRDYVELVDRALKPGGRFGLVCFRPEGGSGLTDLRGVPAGQPGRRPRLHRGPAAGAVGPATVRGAGAAADAPDRRTGALLRRGLPLGPPRHQTARPPPRFS